MYLPYVERGTGTRVAFLHGFTQTKSSWDPVIAAIRNDVHSISFDAPGHGDASMLPFNCSESAEAINNIAGDAIYVGYSMGARIMLHAALAYPEEVSRLILISGSPGLASDSERKARVDQDAALADRIKVVGVEAFVDEWMSMSMFSGLNESNNQRADRLTNTADGLIRSLLLCGTGAQESLWARLHQLKMPVLLIVGEHDAKFCEINQQMRVAVGDNASLQVVPNAGHAVHLESPQVVADLITAFIN